MPAVRTNEHYVQKSTIQVIRCDDLCLAPAPYLLNTIISAEIRINISRVARDRIGVT